MKRKPKSIEAVEAVVSPRLSESVCGKARNLHNSWVYQSIVYDQLSRKQPVKVYTKEEIEAYKKARG